MVVALVALVGCAGTARNCASCSANRFGADWIVVQYRVDGTPFLCWRLDGVSIDNEQNSDGIYWLDSKTGNLVHISGAYSRVQVSSSRWEEAAAHLGVVLAKCSNGAYAP